MFHLPCLSTYLAAALRRGNTLEVFDSLKSFRSCRPCAVLTALKVKVKVKVKVSLHFHFLFHSPRSGPQTGKRAGGLMT
jgi:hypothetical protein